MFVNKCLPHAIRRCLFLFFVYYVLLWVVFAILFINHKESIENGRDEPKKTKKEVSMKCD